jgi:rod shape determining protein RodA
MRVLRLRNHDWFMTITIFLLMLIGLVVIYSATFNAQSALEGAGIVNRQLVFVILGFFVYLLVSNIDTAFYKYFPIQVLIFMVISGLLLYVWLFGDPVRNTNRWIEWGFVRIQPSEYAKVALILLNGGILSELLIRKAKEDINWGEIWKKKKFKDKISNLFKNFTSFYPTLYIYGIAFLICAVCIILVLVEPALGNASILTLICISLFVIAYPRQEKLLGLIVIFLLMVNLAGQFVNFSFFYNLVGFSLVVQGYDLAVILVSMILILLLMYFLRLKILSVFLAIILGVATVFSISYVWNNVLKDYQRKRVEVFFNPEADPQGAGWQLRQAKIAIGSGRLFGKGFLQGSQSKLRYLPEAYSDFIFAAFCEEFGLVGATFVLGLYVFLILRVVATAKSAHTTYESLICVGVAVMLIVHVFVNTGMNMGLLPITGIPLPLISYGGSSVMVTMIALGLVQAVNKHKDIVDTQESLMITSQMQIDME